MAKIVTLETKLGINNLIMKYILLCDVLDESDVKRNLNSFVENVLKDEKGKLVKQAAIHIAWHEHIKYCWDRQLNPIILAPWGSGKCLNINNLVTLSNGMVKGIKDIRVGDELLTLTSDLDYSAECVTGLFRDKDKMLYRLRTRSGREIEATDNHPFKTIHGWSMLKDLKVGACIGVPRGYNFSGKQLKGYLPEFLGFMTGDGGCSHGGTGFTNSSPEILRYMKEICNFYDWEFNSRGIGNTFQCSITNYRQSEGHAKYLLKEHGLDCLSKYKKVPEAIFSACNSDIAKFIGAYFSCDGWVEIGTVCIASASKELMKGVHSLLLRFGIVSTLSDVKYSSSKKGEEKKFSSWGISIYSREMIEKFYNNIPIYHLEKKEKIKNWLKEMEGKATNSNHDLIPNGWEQYLNNNIWSLDWKHKIGYDNNRKIGHNRVRVSKFAEIDGSNYVKNLCKEHILWDEIVSIKSIGVDKTYNLEVATNPNYIANDIFVHNSSQLVIGMPLFWLGMHPEQRIKIICNSDENAMARVKTVSRYIRFDKEYQKFFPNIKPDSAESWTQHEVFIKRPPGVMSIDPSVQAKGVFSTGIGGRADLELFDDIVDRRNAIDQPELRKKLPNVYQDVWISRLEPAGKLAYIATVWHKDDNTHHIMKDTSYCTLKQEVTEDFNKIKTTIINMPDDEHPVYKSYAKVKDSIVGDYVNLPLWQEKWDKPALKRKCGSTTISIRSFDRGFRQRAITTSDLMYPNFEKCVEYGVDPNIIVNKKDFMFYSGVDISSAKRAGNVIFTIAFNPLVNLKIPIDIRSGAWTSPKLAREMADVDRLYRPEVFMVETNSLQMSLIEWIMDKSEEYIFWDRIMSYETVGNVKRSETGLPAMEVEFSNRGWRIYVPHIQMAECECGFCKYINEMNSHPFSTTTDHLMASWFAREACKEGTSDNIYENWVLPEEEGMFNLPKSDYI